MHMHVPYNMVCFILYTMHAAVEAAAARATVWLGPAYSVGFSVASLYTRPAHGGQVQRSAAKHLSIK